MRSVLSKACTTYAPTGLRLLESIASVFGWTISQADVKVAFLQIGEAQTSLYVRLPRKSKLKYSYLWLLLTASYGLVNANAKWKNHSNVVILEIGPKQ